MLFNLRKAELLPRKASTDDTRQGFDGRKAQPEVIAPPRILAFARDVNEEPRYVIRVIDHI